jgi:predicted dehydrogenase
VVGDTGIIEIDLRAPTLTVSDHAGTVTQHETFTGFERQTMFVDELRSFLDSVAQHRDPEVDLVHARDTLRLGLAIRESMETGELVHLDEQPSTP